MTFTLTRPDPGHETYTCGTCDESETFVKGDEIAVARFKRSHRCPERAA